MPYRRLFKKHQVIILPLILVLVLDLCLLAANFIISAQLEKTSVNINIAGRQRMLSQKMMKALMLANHYERTGMDWQNALLELRQASDTFDQTLNAFAVGGLVNAPSGKQFYLRPLRGEKIRETVSDALTIWSANARLIDNVTTNQQISGPWFDSVISDLAADNLRLLGMMNTITNLLEREAQQDTYLLRGLQTIILLMILGSFLLATLRVIRREHYYNTLMEKSTDLVVSIDIRSTEITFISASCQQLLGHPPEYFLKKSASVLFAEDSQIQLHRILDNVYKNKSLEQNRFEMHLLTRNQSVIIADMVMALSISEDGRSDELHIDLRDISERKEAEIELKALAHKDILTGLPNRTMLYELARRQIEICHRNHTRLAVLFMDLDGFKAVNDRWGHHIGDELLIEVGRRISRCLRKSDCVARLGGDEFIILLNTVTDDPHIVAIAEKIIEIVSTPMLIGAYTCQVSASVGVAVYPQHGMTIEALMHSADSAMYRVKHNGKAGVAVAALDADD